MTPRGIPSNCGSLRLQALKARLQSSSGLFLNFLIVGLSLGMLQDQRTRAAGIGADVIVMPPGSSFIAGLTGSPMPIKVAGVLAKLPHLLETVERFEEDLTDRTRVHRPIHATIRVGEALEVSPSREKGGADPLMEGIRSQLEALLTEGQPP